MGSANGIAGSRGPELDAVFLCETEFDVEFFCRMARTPIDVWAVRVEGLPIEDGPDGWVMVRQPISPARLRLARADAPRGGD